MTFTGPDLTIVLLTYNSMISIMLLPQFLEKKIWAKIPFVCMHVSLRKEINIHFCLCLEFLMYFFVFFTHSVQKDCENCGCSYHAYHRESHASTTKPNRPHRLMSNSADSIKNERSSKSHRYRPYSGPHPTDNATPMKEQPVPSSLNLSTSALNPQRRPLGPPKYATPLPSPAVTLPHSPALKPPMFPNPHFPLHVQSTPPPPPPPAVSSSSSSSAPTNTSYKEYDMSRVTNLIMATSNDKDQSSLSYNLTDTGWWQCMYLPDSLSSMQKLVSPMSPWATGFTLLPTTPHGLPSSPNVLPGDPKKGTRSVDYFIQYVHIFILIEE